MYSTQSVFLSCSVLFPSCSVGCIDSRREDFAINFKRENSITMPVRFLMRLSEEGKVRANLNLFLCCNVTTPDSPVSNNETELLNFKRRKCGSGGIILNREGKTLKVLQSLCLEVFRQIGLNKPIDAPLLHVLRTDCFIEVERRFIPIEDCPLHSTAAAGQRFFCNRSEK